MKPELRIKVARDIMALVDEYPSGPLSLERKWIEEKLGDMFARFTQQADDELQTSFDIGYEEGQNYERDEIYHEMEGLRDEIDELKSEIEEVKKEAYTDGFAEGYETARAEFNVT